MIFAKKKEAFTMMEILIVVVIIGFLFTVLGPRLMKQWEKIKVNQTKVQLGLLKSSIQEYYTDVGTFPKKLDDLVSAPSGKLEAKWKGHYTQKPELPEDQWNGEFEYNSPPVRYKNEGYKFYEMYSLGPDGEESDDDIHVGE